MTRTLILFDVNTIINAFDGGGSEITQKEQEMGMHISPASGKMGGVEM